MTATSSECCGYQVLNIEKIKEAKQQAMSNYMCKKCNIPFCGECAKTVAMLKMCSKSIPDEIIENISSYIKCDECTEMIDTTKINLAKMNMVLTEECMISSYTITKSSMNFHYLKNWKWR